MLGRGEHKGGKKHEERRIQPKINEKNEKITKIVQGSRNVKDSHVDNDKFIKVVHKKS
jgi:hypothetical protein